jgi:hypothetical protein
MLDVLGAIAQPINTVLERILPDPAAREAARRELLKMQQDGSLEATRIQLSAILAEANSADPWTSRARPTFLYVMYAVIGLCFAGGVIGVFFPDQTSTAAQNIANLLAAIPEEMWWLFGAGYLGYTGARSVDKIKAR